MRHAATRTSRTTGNALFGGLLATLLVLTAGWASGATAADKPPKGGDIVLEIRGDEPAEAVKRSVEQLAKTGQKVTLRIAAPGAGGGSTVAMGSAADDGMPAVWTDLESGVIRSLEGIRHIPQLIGDWSTQWATIGNASSGTEALVKFAAALALALTIGFAVRRASDSVRRDPDGDGEPSFVRRLGIATQEMLKDLFAIAAFVLSAWALAVWLMPAMDLLRRSFAITVHHTAIAACYLTAMRLLLSPRQPEARLLPIARPRWHARMISIYGVFAAILISTVKVSGLVASDPRAVVGWFALTATLITAFKLWWFWSSRHDVAALVISGAPDPANPTPARRLAAIVLPLLLLLSAVVIWAIGRIAVAVPGGERWAGAAGLTQFLFVIIPVAAAGAQKAARELLGADAAVGNDARHPLLAAAMREAGRAAGWLVWVAGLLLTAGIWGMLAPDAEQTPMVAALNRLAVAAVILFAGYVALSFVKSVLDYQAPARNRLMPSAEEDNVPTVQSRLASVMPVLRGFLLGAVIAVTALVALSKLGIDTGPLLAGFGILGLAVSFGSQALVRDIVSGVFFMSEDAFRVGEYIDTGKLKGTVEKISLRSVQLRHQSGLVHTVPFGQIAAVTNASRDWATVKFNIKIDRRADIEKVRKAIKKVGQQLEDDPEFGSEFILPLKMQGVADIVDNAFVCRLKFTSKPARASWVQREALKRVYKALREADIDFAYNAVMVQSVDGTPATAAGGAAVKHAGERDMALADGARR